MEISLSWLKELARIGKTTEEVQNILVDLGIETEIKTKDILEIEINPNRGDCLSILGIARELSAKLGKPISLPKTQIKESDLGLKLDLNISKDAQKLIPRFTYRIIKGIKIGPSPKEIVEKLESYGFRSLNNVVDITNLVMIELGQPLHAFDWKKIGGKLALRLAKKGEKVLTLDGKERNLPEGALIAEDDTGKITDLAGIMGGFYSEVDEKTETIVLQAAIFDPISIRKTSKFLNHTTDASYRYERGVDFAMTKKALDRATDLILKIAGGEAGLPTEALPRRQAGLAKAGKVEDLKFKPLEKRIIALDPEKLNYLLGNNFSKEEMKEALEKFGFKVLENEILKITVPSFRLYDIYFWQDLAEEVLRFKGYSSLPSENLTPQKSLLNLNFKFKENLKDILIDLGFSETLSYSFISDKDLRTFNLNKKDLLKIKNPLSKEFAFFRPNLEINLLKQVAKNPWFKNINFFEIGDIYFRGEEKEKIIILSTSRSQLEKNLEKLKKWGFDSEINQVSQKILDQLKIKKEVYFLEMDLVYPESGDFKFKDLKIQSCKIPSSFPPAQIDLAFVVDQELDSKIIEEEILKNPQAILTELFDEFKSSKFGKNKKNIAYHLWIEDKNKALSENDIENISQDIVKNIEDKFQAKLRTF